MIFRFLEEEHIQKILKTHQKFEDVDGFARAVPLDEIRANNANLSIAL
jgi:type I restriction enzyme M protein